MDTLNNISSDLVDNQTDDDFDDDDLDDDDDYGNDGEDDDYLEANADEDQPCVVDEGHAEPMMGVLAPCVMPMAAPGRIWVPQPWSVPIPDPFDARDVYVRSAAGLFALNRIEEVVAKILPHGQRQGAAYCAGNLLVAVDFLVDPWFGMLLSPGMWIRDTGLYGFDLLGLHFHVHGFSYSQSATAIFDMCRDPRENGSRQVRKLSKWSQDLNPLHDQLFDSLVHGAPHPSDVCVFRNAAGQSIATITRVRTISGEFAPIWRCLWCRSGSYRSMWAEVFPSEAFFLNADLMRRYPRNPVHVLPDPFDAKLRTGPGSPWIFTALPFGPSSIPSADLAFMEGRDIRVVLDSSSVEELWKIDAALMSAGATSVEYALPKRPGLYQVAADTATQAEVDGFVLKSRKNDAICNEEVVVSRPGQPIPGSEVKRDVLLSPWLKEGYLAWIYAPEKTGKSWLASAVAQAVASGCGVVGKWIPMKRAGALLVDGEMLPDELDETTRLVSVGLDPEHSTPMFEILCAKSQPSGLIDIETEEWQHQIEKRLVGKNLLVLDNLQSLMGNGGSRLKEVQVWFRRLNQRGIAIIILDHTNADGELQGSISKRRIANVVISLKCGSDEDRANGITEVTYEAARRLHGPEAEPFIMQRIHRDGAVTFKVLTTTPEPVEEKISDRIQKMAKVKYAHDCQRLSYAQIKEEYGIPTSTASDLLKAVGGLDGEDLRLFEAAMNRLKVTEPESDEE